MKKGLTITRKVASRDVIYGCWEFLMKKGLIDREKERHVEHSTAQCQSIIVNECYFCYD